MSSATKEKSPVAGEQSGDFGSHTKPTDYNAEKTIATIRAKLCHCGGQVLHVATDGNFFVSTPWGQITKLANLAELEAHVARGER